LRTEQRVLERMKQGRRQAVLGPRAALTVEVAAEGITGELGVAVAASGSGQESGWVEVLCSGVPVERRPLDIEGMPLVAVVDSAGFKPNHQWTAIVPN